MYGPNTIVTVYVAPKDAHTYSNIRSFYSIVKRRWKKADVLGADEVKVLGNNRRDTGNYGSTFGIFGWDWFRGKKEKWYQDIVGDVYYSYFKDFHDYKLVWWGMGADKSDKDLAEKRKNHSTPNTPMFDPSIEFDKNSVSEKIYLKGKTYDEARSSTFRGKQGMAEISSQVRQSYMDDGMSEEEANQKALEKVEVYSRNLALKKNPKEKNEYRFMTEYYNKHVHSTRREMMRIDVNLWFLKEILTHNVNMSLYVMSENNELMKIQGMVGKRCKNTVVKFDTNRFVYSMAHDACMKIQGKGFKPLNKLRQSINKVDNPMYGGKIIDLEKRLTSEYMYDMILEPTQTTWVDTHHNVFKVVDYSKPENLNGKDIVC